MNNLATKNNFSLSKFKVYNHLSYTSHMLRSLRYLHPVYHFTLPSIILSVLLINKSRCTSLYCITLQFIQWFTPPASLQSRQLDWFNDLTLVLVGQSPMSGYLQHEYDNMNNPYRQHVNLKPAVDSVKLSPKLLSECR